MKKILTILSVFISATAFCQVGGMSVSPNGSAPDPSAMLDVNSINKGLLMPRLTLGQRDSIVNPAKGLFIYNIDCDVINYNAGTPASPNWATVNASNVLVAGVSITASPAGAICTGTSVTFSATPSQNNLSPSYQWQVNASNVGTNSSTYTTDSLNNGDVVTCILSSNVQCVTGSPATSNTITVIANTAPTITGTTAASFCSGSSVTLGASASSGTINWYSVSTGGASLSTGASFTISGLTATTTYYVDATANGCTTNARTAVTAAYYPNAPTEPGAISGPTAVNDNDTATYSISALSNTSNYIWTVTAGVINSGQGTTSILVTWPDSAVGSVSVAASNPCASSAAQTENIYVGTETFSATNTGYTGSIQTFTVPYNGNYTIQAFGAAGGASSAQPGGYGAEMQGTFALTQGQQLSILVGQAGVNATGAGGGGGGTFIVLNGNPILVAGGGGGGGGNYGNSGEYSSYPGGPGLTTTTGGNSTGSNISTGGTTNAAGTPGNGNYCGGSGGGATCCSGSQSNQNGGLGGGGGAGFTGDGGPGQNGPTLAYSYTDGAAGGYQTESSYGNASNSYGGYGGGGCGEEMVYEAGGGGGGGYTGGGGGSGYEVGGGGGGGGSYNSGTNQVNNQGVESGNGMVVISW